MIKGTSRSNSSRSAEGTEINQTSTERVPRTVGQGSSKVNPERSFKIGDIVQVAQHERKKRLRKVKGAKSGKQVVVRIL